MVSAIKGVNCTNNLEVEKTVKILWRCQILIVRFYWWLFEKRENTISITEKKSLALRLVVGPGGGVLVLGYFPTFVYWSGVTSLSRLTGDPGGPGGPLSPVFPCWHKETKTQTVNLNHNVLRMKKELALRRWRESRSGHFFSEKRTLTHRCGNDSFHVFVLVFQLLTLFCSVSSHDKIVN